MLTDLNVLQGLLEGEGHAAANDELVNLVNEILDQLDLVGHFCPAENGNKGMHGCVERL